MKNATLTEIREILSLQAELLKRLSVLLEKLEVEAEEREEKRKGLRSGRLLRGSV